MSNKITDLFGAFENEQEKMDFLEAQMNTITSLNKQVDLLRAEKIHLERMLKDAVPVLSALPVKGDEDLSEEQKICKEQLKLLKIESQLRELTMEECRKVEIYSKILQATKDPNKKLRSNLDGMPVADLLKLVE